MRRCSAAAAAGADAGVILRGERRRPHERRARARRPRSGGGGLPRCGERHVLEHHASVASRRGLGSYEAAAYAGAGTVGERRGGERAERLDRLLRVDRPRARARAAAPEQLVQRPCPRAARAQSIAQKTCSFAPLITQNASRTAWIWSICANGSVMRRALHRGRLVHQIAPAAATTRAHDHCRRGGARGSRARTARAVHLAAVDAACRLNSSGATS